MSDLDAYGEAAYLPEGPRPGADLQMIHSGVILEKDIPGKRLRVSYNGGEGTWIPALPNRYIEGRTCFVLCNPLRGGRAEVVLSQIDGSPNTLKAPAVLVSLSGTTAVVAFEGTNYTVDVIPNAYGAAGSQVWVLLNPSQWGAPELMMGPCEFATPDPGAPPVPGGGGGASTVQVRVTIGPTWSGTWRASRGAWDRWNTGQFGGRSDLYQGNAYGSGPLVGLATYGDQLRNLGAISIDSIGVGLIHNGGTGMTGPPVVQGSPHASQPGGAPASSGPTSSDGWLDPTTREGMRTGAVNGLALVGGGYYAVRGTSHPAGMALDVVYTRSA